MRSGSRNSAELNRILAAHVLIRRLKKDVAHQLPALRRSRISVAPDPAGLKVRPVFSSCQIWQAGVCSVQNPVPSGATG